MTSTTNNPTPPAQPCETDAQELARLRHQHNLLLLALLTVLAALGALLALGAALFVRWAPAWADPAQVGIGTFAVWLTLGALAVPLLRHLWRR
ncbi:hypothetical protein ABT213_32625 [Streptomyces sp. NPDC001674]|uniref:hypothetical protein n=1 Tax=Streptomyces sp. NPDC001674 TaxID=3154394 RepID=UPI00332FAFF0